MTERAFRLNPDRFREIGLCRLDWRHGAVLLVALCVTFGAAQAQSLGEPERETALQTLFIWMPFILEGFLLNLLMSFLAMGLATVFGVGLGILQISQTRVIRGPAYLITHLFRNSPWLVILFAIMFLIPFQFRLPGGETIIVPGWVKATIAFSLPVMANISEILRGAIASIPKGQWDSAESLAFTRGQTLRWIILPQCVKRMLPSWMNWYALLALNTPLASILGVHESVGNAQAAMEAAGSRPEYLIPFYLFLMCLFFVYIYPISVWTRRLERKYAVAN